MEVTKRVNSKARKEDILAEKTDNDLELKKLSSPTAIGNKTLSLRVLSRVVIVTSLLIVVYYSSTDEKIKPLARQSSVVVGKGQVMPCSIDYLNSAVAQHSSCFMKLCKRYIADNILTSEEVDGLLSILQKALSVGKSSGGATIFNLYNGKLSKGDNFLNIYQRPDLRNLFSEQDFTLFSVVNTKMKYAVAQHFEVPSDVINPSDLGYFSALSSENPATANDKYWIPQVDYIKHKGSVFTTTICLNDYNVDFKGGRFVFIEPEANRTVESRKGRVVMFTSGPENHNYIERVTSGTRYALNIPFSCKRVPVEEPSLKKFNAP